MSGLPAINLARAYEIDGHARGYRVLVDRLWPRGVRKEDLALDAWLKDLAPSDGLRRWFNHQPARWEEFRKRYLQELHDKSGELDELLAVASRQPVLLIYGSRDVEHNNAVVLRDFLTQRLSEPS